MGKAETQQTFIQEVVQDTYGNTVAAIGGLGVGAASLALFMPSKGLESSIETAGAGVAAIGVAPVAAVVLYTGVSRAMRTIRAREQ